MDKTKIKYSIDIDNQGYYILLNPISSNNTRYCKVLGRYKTYEQAISGINDFTNTINSKLKAQLDKLNNKDI